MSFDDRIINQQFEKKLRLSTKTLMVGLLLFLLVYLMTYSFNTLNETIVMTEEIRAEESNANDREEHHYPGEPIRVINKFNQYWQIKLTQIANQ